MFIFLNEIKQNQNAYNIFDYILAATPDFNPIGHVCAGVVKWTNQKIRIMCGIVRMIRLFKYIVSCMYQSNVSCSRTW